MKKLAVIIALLGNCLLWNSPRHPCAEDADSTSSHSGVEHLNQEPASTNASTSPKNERQDSYQQGLEQVASTKSMKQPHANYAELGSPFKEMTTVQFADLFHRSRGFTLPGTREVSHNMYLQGWNSEIPALADPEPDDCTPEEIEAWYRKFSDPWNAKRPAPTPWARELPFVDPQPYHLVQPVFTVISGRGYRWGIVLRQNVDGDYEPIGQLKSDYKPETNNQENPDAKQHETPSR